MRKVDSDEACRNLYRAVIWQAVEDLNSRDDMVREDAEAFFIDWRLDAMCKAAEMDSRLLGLIVKQPLTEGGQSGGVSEVPHSSGRRRLFPRNVHASTSRHAAQGIHCGRVCKVGNVPVAETRSTL